MPTPDAPPGPPSLWGGIQSHLSQEGARGALIAFVSTVSFLAVAIVAIGTSDRWPLVRQSFFNVDVMRDSVPDIADGFLTNVWMFSIGQVAILGLALVVAVMRSLKGPAFAPLRLLAIVFIDFFRGIPIILGLLFFGFGIPALRIGGLPNSARFWGLLVVILSYSAYTAEVYRSGIDAVPDSQRLSAAALGLTQWQGLRYAILPQAVRNVIPALLNGFVSLQKDVALLAVLGVREAVREAQIISGRTFNFSSYTVATVLFLLVSIPSARFADWYTARDRARRSQTGG